jgi:hypothetical protein
MMDHLDEYLAGGGISSYLGGNGLFEQVEIDEAAQTLTHMADDPTRNREGFYFRNLQPPRPERSVLGVAYRYDNYMTLPVPVLGGPPALQGPVSNGHSWGARDQRKRSERLGDGHCSRARRAGRGRDGNGRRRPRAPPANLVVLARGTTPASEPT